MHENVVQKLVILVDKSNVESTSQIGRELAGATQSALAASGLAGLGGGADSPIPSTSSGQPSTKRQKTNKLVMYVVFFEEGWGGHSVS